MITCVPEHVSNHKSRMIIETVSYITQLSFLHCQEYSGQETREATHQLVIVVDRRAAI